MKQILIKALLSTTAGDTITVPTFSANPAYSGGFLRVPGYNKRVVVDLRGLEVPATIPVLLNHQNNTASVIGQGEPTLTKGVLSIDGTLIPTQPGVPPILNSAKAGHKWQGSVGVEPLKTQDIPAGQMMQVNGLALSDPAGFILVTSSRLREFSIVAVGADGDANLQINAAYAAESTTSMPDLNNSTADIGAVNAAELEQLTTAAAENERTSIKAMAVMCKDHPGILTAALDNGWGPERVSTEVKLASLRAIRPNVNASYGGGSRGMITASATPLITAALLLHGGQDAVATKAYGERTVQQAADLRCRSLLDICAAALTLAGQDIPQQRHELIRASFSTMSMPGAFANTANKVALDAYRENSGSWRSIARIIPLKDFKAGKVVRAIFGGNFEKVGKTGELKHGHMSDTSADIQLDTSGMVLGISRQDILSDDLGVFLGTSQAIGRAGARVVCDEVYKQLLLNPGSFFAAGNSNYVDGAGTVLSYASLVTGVQSMRARTGPGGENLDLQATTLLTPLALEETALQLLNSTTVQRYVSSGIDNAPMGNPLFNRLKNVSEPRLSNTKFTGASTTGWYLFSLPTDGGVSVGFLDGNDAPTIEQFQQEPTSLGLLFRGFLDFGVALSDPRCAYFSKGAA